MTIDYAAIIEKANTRKDSLIAFEAACQELRMRFEASKPLVEAMARFLDTFDALDAEAHSLLPTTNNAEYTLRDFVHSLNHPWKYAHVKNRGTTPSDVLGLLAGNATD